jgi:hypothetical protein
MRRVGGFGLSCLLLVAVTACKVDTQSLSDDGPERSCTRPRLHVLGPVGERATVTVHPGQTIRLHGVHYTDDCAAGGAGTGVAYRRLQLILQSPHRIGALATVHPRGEDSAFTVDVTIPTETIAGPAKISDSAGSTAQPLRLVVRP